MGLGIGIAVVTAVVAAIVAGLWAWLGLAGMMAICFAVVCVFLMLVILIQKPKGGGLSGAFGGGGGSSQAAFGSKTGDVLTYVTIALFVAFLGLAMGLTWTGGTVVKAAPAPPTQNTTAKPPPATSQPSH